MLNDGVRETVLLTKLKGGEIMKACFSKLWLDFKKDRRSILVYVLISGLMWVISVLLMGDYG